MSLLAVLASAVQEPPPSEFEAVGPLPPSSPDPDDTGLEFLTFGGANNHQPIPDGNALPLYDRALSWYFENEDVVISWTEGDAVGGWELRDYEGQVVAAGATATSPLNLGRPGVGWYKLYLIRSTSAGLTYGLAGGETMFIVSRVGVGLRDTPLPMAEDPEGREAIEVRPFIGTGCLRVDVDINNSDRASWRTTLDQAKIVCQQALEVMDLDEPDAPDRVPFIHFPDGEATGGAAPTAEQQYQITTTVQEMCALGVTHFEGRNEPVTSGITGAETAAEYAAFASLVHAAHPDAKVLGPCPVTINPTGSGLGWFRDFLEADGGDHLDVITFHPYNATNNDANQGRRVYDGFLDLLAEFGQHTKPRWMTEYGHYTFIYGSFEPRWHAQVMMTEGLLLWQRGIHRNHVMHYYDFNVGYWDQPMFMWTSDRGRKCPTPLPLMWRTWVEETWGMDHDAILDFGAVENRHFIGSRFVRADGTGCLTIMSSGRSATVELDVAGASSLAVADHFGRVTAVPVQAGAAVIPVGPEPVHVRVPAGTTATVRPRDYGADVTPRGTASTVGSTGGNGTARALDGRLQNWYETQLEADREWQASPGDAGPSWWRVDFPSPVTFDRVEVICPPPWQSQGSLLDFDVHALIDGVWRKIYTKVVPTPQVDWTSDKAVGGSWVDSFWSRERIFVVGLSAPVTATGVRVFARDMSFGGGATVDQARTVKWLDGGGQPTLIGQSGRKRMTLQEVTIYNSGTAPEPGVGLSIINHGDGTVTYSGDAVTLAGPQFTIDHAGVLVSGDTFTATA